MKKREKIKLPLKTNPFFKSSIDAKVIDWLKHREPAVTGQGGHNRTFFVACTLIHGFELDPDEAYPFFADWNQFCEPPWSEQELWHKLYDARKTEPIKPRGYMLRKYYKADERAWLDCDLKRLSWSKAIYLPVREINDEKAIFLPRRAVNIN